MNLEIKRRSDEIYVVPNDEAVIQLIGAPMLETNDEWTVVRRYLSRESLARFAVRLSAVAT